MGVRLGLRYTGLVPHAGQANHVVGFECPVHVLRVVVTSVRSGVGVLVGTSGDGISGG
jgi:hypothetical protein